MEIQDFVNCIENDVEPLVNGEQGLISLKATIAAVESWKLGEVINID